MIFLFLFFFWAILLYVSLKIGELIINKYRRNNYKLDSNTTILITGACSGLGKQVALNFSKAFKCHIIIFDILNEIPKTICKYYGKYLTKLNFQKRKKSKKMEERHIILNVILQNMMKLIKLWQRF